RAGAEMAPRGHLVFERGEERIRGGVVETRIGPARGLHHPKTIARSREIPCCVGQSAIGVEDDLVDFGASAKHRPKVELAGNFAGETAVLSNHQRSVAGASGGRAGNESKEANCAARAAVSRSPFSVMLFSRGAQAADSTHPSPNQPPWAADPRA